MHVNIDDGSKISSEYILICASFGDFVSNLVIEVMNLSSFMFACVERWVYVLFLLYKFSTFLVLQVLMLKFCKVFIDLSLCFYMRWKEVKIWYVWVLVSGPLEIVENWSSFGLKTRLKSRIVWWINRMRSLITKLKFDVIEGNFWL